MIDTDTRTGLWTGSWIYGLQAVPTIGCVVVVGFSMGEVVVIDMDSGTELSRVDTYDRSGPILDLVVTPGEDPRVVTCAEGEGLRWWELNDRDAVLGSNPYVEGAERLALHLDHSGEHLIYLDNVGDVWSLDLGGLRDESFDHF